MVPGAIEYFWKINLSNYQFHLCKKEMFINILHLKGLSPTIAFTPTSVMRKIQSEKTENKEQKTVQQQNGNIFFGKNIENKFLSSLYACLTK